MLFYFHSWISGQLCSLKDQVTVLLRNAKLNEKERREVREKLDVELEQLKKSETSISKFEDAISNHQKIISQQLTSSYFQSEEVKRRFCTWKEEDLPHIDDCHKNDQAKIKETCDECIENRFWSFVENWESKEKLLANASANLDRLYDKILDDLSDNFTAIESTLLGESRVACQPFETRPGIFCATLDPKTKKFLVMTLGIFAPILIPVGLAAGLLYAPVLGYKRIGKHLKELQLKNDQCTYLSELSTKFLQDSVRDQVFRYVQDCFFDQKDRIAKVKKCHKNLIARYEQKSNELANGKDESRDKETLEKYSPLNEKLQEMNDKLMFDAIIVGVQVMNPPCLIDITRIRWKVQNIIGGGSYGQVYNGFFTAPGRERQEVAVKIPKDSTCPSDVVSYLKEAAILK